MRRNSSAAPASAKPSASIDVPPVVGCWPLPVPLAPPWFSPPFGAVVVVVLTGRVVVVVAPAPAAVVVVTPADDDDDDEEPVAFTVVGVAAVVPVVPVEPGTAVVVVVDGFVVVDAPCVVSLPPRSPGCVTASAMPAPKTTIAAINRSDARSFSVATSSSGSG